MEICDLRYVAAAADLGSFTRAAAALHLNAATISRRIAHLEDELGLTLFERSTAGVRLTGGGKAVVVQVRRALAEFDTVASSGTTNGLGVVGQVRLGVRISPVGEPVRSLLSRWRDKNPEVALSLSELCDRELASALGDRRLDAVLVPSFTIWPHVASLPVYQERLVAALPADHPLASRETLDWQALKSQTILVQGWEESQAQREFFASLLGSGAKFQVHAASKLSILALVSAGYGVTIAAVSYAETVFPGIVFKCISEPDAMLRMDLVWLPEAEGAVVGRFVSYIRHEARSLRLLDAMPTECMTAKWDPMASRLSARAKRTRNGGIF